MPLKEVPFGELQTKMEKEGRKENDCRRVQPEDSPVQRIQFAGIAVREEYKRNEADIIEVRYGRLAKALNQHERSDGKEINAKDLQIQTSSNQGLSGWVDRYRRRFKPHSVTFHRIACGGVDTNAVKGPRDVAVTLDFLVIDPAEKVSLLNTGPLACTILDNNLSLNSLVCLDPQATVVGNHIAALLLNVEAANNEQPQCQQGRPYKPEGKKFLTHARFGNWDTDYRTEVWILVKLQKIGYPAILEPDVDSALHVPR